MNIFSESPQLAPNLIQTRIRYFIAYHHLFFRLMIQLQLEILKALLLFVFFLETGQLAVRWDFKDGLNKTFTVIFCH